MNWNFSCRKTRRLLALSAGNDLEVRDLPGAHRHLAICPQCRDVWNGLRRSQQVLERVSAAPVGDRERVLSASGVSVSGRAWGSIWPAVARHLRVIHEQASAPNWRGWLPAGALAAACLGLVIITTPKAPFGARTADHRSGGTIQSQNASAPSNAGSVRPFSMPTFRGPAYEAFDREASEAVRPVQLRQGADEPRSF